MADFTEEETIDSSRHTVAKYLYKPRNQRIAVKFIPIPVPRYDDSSKENKFKQLIREFESMRTLNYSENIVELYGMCLYKEKALLCMEIMDMTLKVVKNFLKF